MSAARRATKRGQARNSYVWRASKLLPRINEASQRAGEVLRHGMALVLPMAVPRIYQRNARASWPKIINSRHGRR